MTIARFAPRFALVIGAALAFAPSQSAAQSRTVADRSAEPRAEEVAPVSPALAGCSGVSWAQVRTADGTAYPVVTQVDGRSPADDSGIKEGDVILSVNGRDARKLDTWFVAAPGETVKVRIERDGKPRDVQVTAGRVQELAPEKFAVQCVSTN